MGSWGKIWIFLLSILIALFPVSSVFGTSQNISRNQTPSIAIDNVLGSEWGPDYFGDLEGFLKDQDYHVEIVNGAELTTDLLEQFNAWIFVEAIDHTPIVGIRMEDYVSQGGGILELADNFGNYGGYTSWGGIEWTENPCFNGGAISELSSSHPIMTNVNSLAFHSPSNSFIVDDPAVELVFEEDCIVLAASQIGSGHLVVMADDETLAFDFEQADNSILLVNIINWISSPSQLNGQTNSNVELIPLDSLNFKDIMILSTIFVALIIVVVLFKSSLKL